MYLRMAEVYFRGKLISVQNLLVHVAVRLAPRKQRVQKCTTELKMASALNYPYDDKIGYEWSQVIRQIALSGRTKILAVQYRVVGYLKERRHKVWRQHSAPI